jgi:hypothetical protein
MTRDEAWGDLQFAGMDAEDLRDKAQSLVDKLEEIGFGLAEDADDLTRALVALYLEATARGSVTADEIKAAALDAGVSEDRFDPDDEDDEDSDEDDEPATWSLGSDA